MNKIDFLIVGGMKCASSSIRNYLNAIPGYKTLSGEGAFFNNDQKYTKGLSYYLSLFGDPVEVQNLSLGEKTVDYSLDPNVPCRIREMLPDVKLIWILRDPLTRTYSNYLHEYKRGFEPLSFDRALQRELEGKVKNGIHSYIGKSRYSVQIERFLEFFPKEQILFMSFEALEINPIEEVRRLQTFMGINSGEVGINYVQAHPTILPRFPRLVRWVRQYISEQSIWYVPVSILNNYGKKPGYTPMSQEQRAQLQEIFKEEKYWMDHFEPRISKHWNI